jgi:hypothetical protein
MEPMNVLSPELTKIVNDARPKKGQVIYFESLRPQGGGTTVQSTDRIFDPFVKNSDGSRGAYTDIGYVIGQLPARGNIPAMHNFGRIQFTRTSGNTIATSGNSRADDTLFLYLFLTNFNKMNKGQEWYAPSDGQMPLFTQQALAMKSEERNKFRRRVTAASQKIEGMSEEKLLGFALSLEMKGINEFSKLEEIKDKLYDIAEKNPDRVLNMDKDINLNMRLFIKEALKYNIWIEDKALGLFVWPDTKSHVFLMTPGQDLYAETIKYLLGPGESTYMLVKGLIDKAKLGNKNSQAGKGTVGAAAAELAKGKGGQGLPENKIVINKEVVEVPE